MIVGYEALRDYRPFNWTALLVVRLPLGEIEDCNCLYLLLLLVRIVSLLGYLPSQFCGAASLPTSLTDLAFLVPRIKKLQTVTFNLRLSAFPAGGRETTRGGGEFGSYLVL